MFSYDHEIDKKLCLECDFNDFIDITTLNTAESTNKIKNYNLDILIDLTTIISHNRSHILNKDIAKVIISYLAFPGTTGNDIYDHILTDKIVTPLEQQKNYNEEFMYLPNSYQINNGEINTEINGKRSDFNLPEGCIVLGCLNQSFKLDPVFFNIWVNVLEKNDNTCLWLLDYGDEMRENINNFIGDRINSERIIYADRLVYELHLKRIQHIDIALDTRVYNGHTTTIEMIQAGVPLITCEGNHFASRVSASILINLELEILVTKSYKEYEDKIVSLIDKETRIFHKNLIKNKINDERLFNVKKFANGFEQTILKCFK
jgi:protein O-GlcNAc transferase